MDILLACYSRTGNTARVADAIAAALRAQGHRVTIETIAVEHSRSKWRLALPLLSTLPVLPLYLASARFRRWWLQRYPQPEQPIRPLACPDVSGFDAVCIGGPKWLYIAYPVARYLQQVQGLAGKPVGVFASFCGPPLKAFEIDMLFVPLRRRIEARGARLAGTLAISSQFHEFFFFHEMEYVFRFISRIAFKRPLRSFALGGAWADREIDAFCRRLTGNRTAATTSDTVLDMDKGM